MKNNPVKNSFLILMLVVAFTACGLKGNPVPYPPLPDKKPAVKNMEAAAAADGVALKWSLQDKYGLIDKIGIEKSELGTPGNECRTCPRTFSRIGQITLSKEKFAEKQLQVLNYTDSDVVKGKVYTYRLMLCEGDGNCSEASQVEIDYR